MNVNNTVQIILNFHKLFVLCLLNPVQFFDDHLFFVDFSCFYLG